MAPSTQSQLNWWAAMMQRSHYMPCARADHWIWSCIAMRAMAGRIVRGRDLDQLHATSLLVESHHAQVDVARDGEVGALETP